MGAIPPEVITWIGLAAGALLFIVALIVAVTTLLRLRMAFAEKLHSIPGASWWTRAKQAARFWVLVAVNLAVLGLMLVYIALVIRFVLRLAI